MKYEIFVPGIGKVELEKDELEKLGNDIKRKLERIKLEEKIKAGDLTEAASLIGVAERRMSETSKPEEKKKYESDIAEIESMLRKSPIIQDPARLKEYFENLERTASIMDYYSYERTVDQMLKY